MVLSALEVYILPGNVYLFFGLVQKHLDLLFPFESFSSSLRIIQSH